jgi:hypothetical protein
VGHVKVLFCIGHDGFIRNFESCIRTMVEREHSVVLAVSGRRPALMSDVSSIEDLCERYDGISHTRAPKGRDDVYAAFTSELWAARDYLRFLTPEFRDANELRARARKFAPAWAQRFGETPLARHPGAVRATSRGLQRLADAMPLSEEVVAFFREQDPDVDLITPVINFHSGQNSLIRAAMAAGLPTALLVHSWDNLTNKGLIQHAPDRVLVWNEAQKKEAVELQGIDRNRVVVTGAQSYDQWFDWESRDTRESFCGKVGLDPARRFLLYVCSSAFIAPEETEFVHGWIDRLRSSGRPELEEIGILVRPHPQLVEQWQDSLRYANVSIWPRPGADLAGEQARSDYFESFHHAEAVVGINTSAFVEAAIMGKPTLTVLADQYRDTQEGTLHFAHLADDGALIAARTFEEHLTQLQRILRGEDLDAGRSRRFVESFVRPLGGGRPATEYLVDAVEQLAGAPLVRERGGTWWHPAARRVFKRAAVDMQSKRGKAKGGSGPAKAQQAAA